MTEEMRLQIVRLAMTLPIWNGRPEDLIKNASVLEGYVRGGPSPVKNSWEFWREQREAGFNG